MAEGKENLEQSGDFERSAVPMTARRSFWAVTMVWTGYVFLITSMMTGGGLAAGFTFKTMVAVTVTGNIFLSAIAIAISYIACKSGLTFALMSRFSFGLEGSRMSSFFGPVINLGWYTVQSAVYGHFIAEMLGLDRMGENIAMILSAIVMGIFAFIGIEALTVLGLVAVPAIIFLSVATMFKSVAVGGGGWGMVFNSVPMASSTFIAGVTTVVGTWIFAASTGIADIMRYARNIKEAAGSTVLGLVGGNSLMILCGAVTALTAKNADLTAVLFQLGLVFPAFILITTNLFTTNAANIYSNALGMSNVFRKVNSKTIMCVLIAIAAVLTLTRPYEINKLFTFLNTLAKVVPPLPGIILADFFIIRKMNYNNLGDVENKGINFNAVIAWILATIVVFLLKDFGFAPLNGIIAGAGLYLVFTKLRLFSSKKVTVSERSAQPEIEPVYVESKKVDPAKVTRGKVIALLGIAVLGVGSFVGCLATGSTAIFGSVLLGLGVLISSYGFIYWRP